MIIKEIRIKNFRSYYGDNNVFKFSDGLTLLLGENGDGKTTFFEAIHWLLNTTLDKGNIDNVSEMRKSKLEIGEQDEVSVFMAFEHDGEKSVEKSFSFERVGDNSYRIGPLSFSGYETNGAERVKVNGKTLIDRCYDAFIQRFSMFKGESELNVFNSESALKQLVDKFSDIRKFDTLVNYVENFKNNAYTAFNKEIKADKNVADAAKTLEQEINKLSEQIFLKRKDVKEKESSIAMYTSQLTELEDNQETAEQYKEIEERRKSQEDKKYNILGKIGAIDYNHSLLDKMWVLCAFPSVFQEYKSKCSALSVEKRRQEKDFDRQQAERIGRIKAVKEIQGTLVNGSTELPWYLPNQETMEEMIHDHICKVCGRPAEEGSDAYEFMVAKLNEYKNHVEAKLREENERKEIEEQTLFPNEFIEQLHNLSISLSGSNESAISQIAHDIAERRDFVDRKKKELQQVNDKLQDINDERARLLIQAGNVSPAVLDKNFNEIKGLFEQKGKAEIRLTELNSELEFMNKRMKQLKDDMNALDPKSSQAKLLKEVHKALELIAGAFYHAKEDNLRRFLAELQDKSNEYLETLSANDFHGEIHLVQTADESTEIKLMSANGTEIKKPSGSQKTVMYISVLFAISDYTQHKRDEDYPLIFDAATSSFGDLKESDFYNVINKLRKQCIIITKDFITKGQVRMSDVEKLNCPVYRIQKASGFNQSDLSTIRTTVNKLKD